jgi:NitT/TauT family transport system permease protein
MPGTAPLQKRKTPRARRRATFDTPLRRVALQVAAVITFFALWEIGVRAGWISAFLVGSPSGIFAFAFKMIASGELLSDTWYTCSRPFSAS